MDRQELQRLRDLPIEEVAERLGLQVVRHKALCPFHDDHHASLSFCPRRNTYRCFACGAHGGVIDLAMNHLKKDFRETITWLSTSSKGQGARGKGQEGTYPKGQGARGNLSPALPQGEGVARPPSLGGDGGGRLGGDGGGRRGEAVGAAFDSRRYERFFEHPWLLPEARRFLFEERRLDERVVRWCRLTSWRDRRGVPWLQIPYYDRERRLVGVQNRNLVPGALPRFRFPAGSRCGIYGLPVLARLRPGDDLWLCEGPSDCWAMLSSGRKAIAIPSATLLTRQEREQLAHLTSHIPLNYHMFPDNDAPGERLFLQLREVLPTLRRHQLPPGCKDFGELFLTSRHKKNT